MKKIFILLIVITLLVMSFGVRGVKAAALTGISDTMDRQKVSEASDHTIKYRVTSGMTSGTIVIDFNTPGFDDGSVEFGDIDFFYGSSQAQVNGACESSCTNATLAAAAGAGAWGAAFAANVLTLSYPTSGGTALVANDYVRIEIGYSATGGNAQLANPATTSTASQKVIEIVSGSDVGNVAVAILTDDQVAVGATIIPTLTFTISDVVIGFGEIDSTTVYYATADSSTATTEPANNLPTKLTASTNAASGLTITIQSTGSGAAAGLYNSTFTELIEAAASTAVAGGTDGYGVYGKNSSNLTIAEGYDNDSNSDSAITTAATTLASTTGVVSSGTMDVAIKAGIGAATKAGAYTDTLSLICTGNF